MTGSDPGSRARAVVELLGQGRFDEVEELLAPSLRALVPTGGLGAAWLAGTGGNGAVRAVGEARCDPDGPVRVPVTFERGLLTAVVSFDEAGLLDGLRVDDPSAPSWTPPPYARQEAFDEHEVTVGSGEPAVPGTLAVPRGTGPWPGVVLLAGGGPFDRDGTTGPNKPLKDLAWGLAGLGVAVLRFDKVTCAHPGHVPPTMTDEYVPHAVAAVRLLRERADVGRVFVAGHSMGGKVGPRVAAAEPSVAGLVLLAGDAEPMHRAAVRVVRHLAALDPGARAAVETFERQAAAVEDPGLSADTPAAALPFGLPGSYWLDLRGYDPVASAAALDKPMLILQGGRDYQVTVSDDLARWRAGLAHRTDVTFRVHDADDHFFFPGTGPVTPADYTRPQHVDPEVVSDIAAWLGRYS
ncbi:alpha/beta hydrolase [Nonomuraea aridisoli]|uniref:alpha/beta hydrolase n=1 Tax=Nonomuraea aridisoli TaxID=2070368 RepID=UPI00269DE447